MKSINKNINPQRQSHSGPSSIPDMVEMYNLSLSLQFGEIVEQNLNPQFLIQNIAGLNLKYLLGAMGMLNLTVPLLLFDKSRLMLSSGVFFVLIRLIEVRINRKWITLSPLSIEFIMKPIDQ